MSIDGLNSPNSPRQIDHQNYTSLSKKSNKLDDIFQNYLKKTFIEDVICENCSLVHSETKKSIFTFWRNLKEPPSVFKILLQRGTYDMTTFQAIKNEYKVAIPS